MNLDALQGIPDTIVFKYNCPWRSYNTLYVEDVVRSVWYFTSVDGTIKRKHKAKLDAEKLGSSAWP